jgi:phenylalanyl-tRNA synthetase alpha chain
MIDQLSALEERARADLAAVGSAADLDQWRLRYLGRTGEVTLALRGIGNAPADQRPALGASLNQLRTALETALEVQRQQIESASRAAAPPLDVTLPGRAVQLGHLHPTTRVLRDILSVFSSLGFRIAEGPEVELDRYNFELLNISSDHPARDMWDTYYIHDEAQPGKILLRTHTSPNQARIMQATEPPIRVVVPGKCYRYEAVDATHETVFYQVEGLAVDRGITMADLKGTLTAFAQALFGRERRVMFYCSYFPFVEPGVEVAIDCFVCKGAGCRLCKQSGWIEIMGAGMVHPRVLEMAGCDPAVYTGFAFGLGPERVAMLKYGIEDIRQFYANDLRFLRQVR